MESGFSNTSLASVSELLRELEDAVNSAGEEQPPELERYAVAAKALSSEEEGIPDLYAALAAAYMLKEDWRAALAWQQKAADCLERTDLRDTELAAYCYDTLIWLHWQLGNYLDAFTLEKSKQLPLLKKLFPDGAHPLLAKHYTWFARLHHMRGDWWLAYKWQKKAIRLLEALCPENENQDLAQAYQIMQWFCQDFFLWPIRLYWKHKEQKAKAESNNQKEEAA